MILLSVQLIEPTQQTAASDDRSADHGSLITFENGSVDRGGLSTFENGSVGRGGIYSTIYNGERVVQCRETFDVVGAERGLYLCVSWKVDGRSVTGGERERHRFHG